jgi:hypothetical protein
MRARCSEGGTRGCKPRSPHHLCRGERSGRLGGRNRRDSSCWRRPSRGPGLGAGGRASRRRLARAADRLRRGRPAGASPATGPLQLAGRAGCGRHARLRAAAQATSPATRHSRSNAASYPHPPRRSLASAGSASAPASRCAPPAGPGASAAAASRAGRWRRAAAARAGGGAARDPLSPPPTGACARQRASAGRPTSAHCRATGRGRSAPGTTATVTRPRRGRLKCAACGATGLSNRRAPHGTDAAAGGQRG